MTDTLGFANGNDSIVVDIGHNYTKACYVRDGRAFDGCEFPTVVAEVSAAKFSDRASAAETVPGVHPELIEYRNRYYVVGEDAYSAGQVIKAERQQRYTREYYGVILASIILSIYKNADDVPLKLNVFAGYPPSDRNEKEAHIKSMIGKWSIGTVQGRVAYTVDFVARYPEVVGGAMNVVLARDGRRYEDHPILTDGPTVVLDVGGGTTDVTVLDKGGMPKYTYFASADVGVNNVIAEFIDLFGRKYKDLLNASYSRNGLPLSRVYECFLDPELRVMLPSEIIDAHDLFEQASQRTLNQIELAYKQIVTEGNLAFNQALVSGGGGGLLFDSIKSRVFSVFTRGNLHTSDNRSSMIYANVRGAAKMVVAMTNVNPKVKQYAK